MGQVGSGWGGGGGGQGSSSRPEPSLSGDPIAEVQAGMRLSETRAGPEPSAAFPGFTLTQRAGHIAWVQQKWSSSGLPCSVTLWVWVWTAKVGLSAGRHHCPQCPASSALQQPAPVCPPSRGEEGVCAGNQELLSHPPLPHAAWQGLLVTVNGNPVTTTPSTPASH